MRERELKTLQKSEDKLNYFVNELVRIEDELYDMYKKRLKYGSPESETALNYWLAIYALKNHLLNDESFPILDDIEE